MRAWWLDGPGGVDAFELKELPIPQAKAGWLVVKVAAFGLNRSELFSRRGMSSPDFSFPRVLGLECVGTVLDPSDSELGAGQQVMCMMGGMGRGYHGGYATHLLVPRSQVFPVSHGLSDADWGALPETYNTAYQVCVKQIALRPDDRVLIRGGTSALGMACSELAKDLGCHVVTTSRKPEKLELLRSRSRADGFVLDGDDFAKRVLEQFGPRTCVVECVGAKQTIETSVATMPDGGRLGLVGQLSESWDRDGKPNIPANVTSGFARSDLVNAEADTDWMADIVRKVEAKRLSPNIHQVFDFEDLPKAQEMMGSNGAVGKLVVLTG